MAQKDAWEDEYRNPKMVTKKEEPQADTRDFFRWLRKEQGVDIDRKTVLDLGCGTGRNTNYVAEEGAHAIGYDFSETAIRLARQRAELEKISVKYEVRSIGEKFPLQDSSVDVILDVMSSNSLSEAERATYAGEIARVARPGGFVYYKGLCKDGDQNAKELLKRFPGPELDTYIMPDLGVIERVFTEALLRAVYEPAFTILHLEKKTNYNRIDGRIYKRNYWIGYFQKK